MGSLISSPKAPTPVAVAAPPPAAAEPPPVEIVQDNTPQEDASEARRSSLLARDRGRFGTVATSFQGFLSENNSGGRKTLLGE